MAETPSDAALKKEKEALQKAKNNEVKNLEFVKVDVDNNMVRKCLDENTLFVC
jgi:hypothetical protein